MVDFVSEVQEELRKDDYNRWLKRYGPYLLAVIVLVIAGAGYMEWNKAREDSLARATSASFLSAVELASEGNTTAAVQGFLRVAEKAPAGYAGLSYMRAAELELELSGSSRAVELLDKAAEVFETERHKQLAQIKAAYILAGEGAYSEVLSRVSPLAEKDKPYEFLARELLGFAAHETGNLSLAREQYSYLNTIPGVPQSIQERAKQSLDMMSVNAIGTVTDMTPTDPTETLPNEATETDVTEDGEATDVP